MVFYSQLHLKCPYGNKCKSEQCLFSGFVKDAELFPFETLRLMYTKRKEQIQQPTMTLGPDSHQQTTGSGTLNQTASNTLGKRKANADSSLATYDKEKPVLGLCANMKFPWKLRQMVIDKLYGILVAQGNPDAAKLALSMESELYRSNSVKSVYQSLAANKISSLTNTKAAPKHVKTTPTDKELEQLKRLDAACYKDLWEKLNVANRNSTTASKMAKCERCGQLFEPEVYYSWKGSKPACQYHPERLYRDGEGVRRYQCCHESNGGKTCSVADNHVFAVPSIGCIDTDGWNRITSTTNMVLSVDAEMIYTTMGREIVRFSVVNWNEQCLLDLMLQPKGKVIDYNTRYSGVRAGDFEEKIVAIDGIGSIRQPVALEDLIATILPTIMSGDTMIVGHGLENDLLSLGIRHKHCIDTAIIYRDFNRTPSLKVLTKKHLGEFIQESYNQGHDSIEDAIMALRLVKLKLNEPPGSVR